MPYRLNKIQLDKFSNFLIDLAKILFGSTVVGFFVPGFSGNVDIATFVIGIAATFTSLVTGLKIVEKMS